ncbi:Myb-like_DNA-binding domain-containing protein [Hexamita inflata]|uniref:Myb-like DNA-binding domain-containing protein n=1 Tax=Hexamita inflata TaxID=28002 RepID=A0AA86Q9G2_9EUKA|nr:Myb-like DNA-binding domain-containing protein [Hexamita inflata]
MKVNKWNEEDKIKLKTLVQQHTKNKRTDWKSVSSNFTNRTPNQCRNYFQHYISENINKQANYIWKMRESLLLAQCVTIYGHKWKLISKLEFPQFTTEQLRQEYLMFQKRLNWWINQKYVLENDSSAEPLNQKQYSPQSQLEYVYFYRKFIQMHDYDQPSVNFNTHVAEQRVMLQYDQQFDFVNVLQLIFNKLSPEQQQMVLNLDIGDV